MPPSKRSQSPARSAAPPGVEEVALDRCLVRDRRAWPVLAGEGERHGMFITLHTARREGLAARLRQRGITVAWLSDLIAALASPPMPPAAGPAWWYHPAAGERVAQFDRNQLDWVACDAVPLEVVPGMPLRLRRTRGAPAYVRVGAMNLAACGADEAYLLGYACARPARLSLVWRSDGLVVPVVGLPAAHAALLRRLTRPDGSGALLAAHAALPLIEACFARLGVVCHCIAADG